MPRLNNRIGRLLYSARPASCSCACGNTMQFHLLREKRFRSASPKASRTYVLTQRKDEEEKATKTVQYANKISINNSYISFHRLAFLRGSTDRYAYGRARFGRLEGEGSSKREGRVSLRTFASLRKLSFDTSRILRVLVNYRLRVIDANMTLRIVVSLSLSLYFHLLPLPPFEIRA